ncbi:MAG: hypothetical protein JW958_13655 [Candidatus Eisenbacteria bacterium]|nr:hypothetical protein [Candidatus Eisenbacteria bacterium]
MKYPARLFLTLFCLLFFASLLHAAVPGLMNYQGVLTDAGGAIVPDGDYDVFFAIYKDSVDADSVWCESRTVTVEEGVFSVILGSLSPLTENTFEDTPRWMGITVESDPEMTPRMKITAVPWAIRAAVADSAVVAGGAGADADWTIYGDNMYSGVSGNVGIGTDDPLYPLHVVGNDSIGSAMIGPEATINEDSRFLFSEDDDGTYGIFLHYNGAANQLEIGGLAGGTEYGPHAVFSRNSPLIEFSGSAGSALFNLNGLGNSTVTLPGDAVAAAEILDEPGVACSTWTGTYQWIGSTPTVLLSRSIVCPAAGYVLAIATAHVQWHIGSSYAFDCHFALSTQTTVMPDPYYSLQLPGGMPWGTYNQPVTIHGLFPVSTAGTHTFYFLGEIQVSDFDLYDKTLTLLYVPTAYGNVSEPLTAGGPVNDPEVGAERAAAEAANAARLEKEVAGLREEIEAIRAELRAEEDR